MGACRRGGGAYGRCVYPVAMVVPSRRNFKKELNEEVFVNGGVTSAVGGALRERPE